MQQLFSTRNVSVRDFEEWQERGELVLAPKFQRRDVWAPKAKSFLVDTILRGKPIPKLYMRQDIHPTTRRTTREIVDGQQRLKTILSFIEDGFKISKTHNERYGGKYFSWLPEDIQKDILKYEFVVDLLQDIPDAEIYDIFARINTYSEKLKPQELRNAKYFGEFKTCVYSLSKEFLTFFEHSKIFTPKQMLRMAEAEFVSDLLLAIEEGIREGKASIIDAAYKAYDDRFPSRRQHEKQFRETMDVIGAIAGAELAKLRFKSTRLFYPLFCAVFHMKFGLRKINVPRKVIKVADYPKIMTVLEEVDDLLQHVEDAKEANEPPRLSVDDRKFYEAFNEHWVHADKRTTMTLYLCRRFASVLRT